MYKGVFRNIFNRDPTPSLKFRIASSLVGHRSLLHGLYDDFFLQTFPSSGRVCKKQVQLLQAYSSIKTDMPANRRMPLLYSSRCHQILSLLHSLDFELFEIIFNGSKHLYSFVSNLRYKRKHSYGTISFKNLTSCTICEMSGVESKEQVQPKRDPTYAINSAMSYGSFHSFLNL